MGTFDLLSGFHQRTLHPESRPLTTCHTPIGSLQLTSLPIGYTNSMQEFQRTTSHTLSTMGKEKALAFVDDIGLLGSKSRYDEKPIPENPNIRQFIWEYAHNLYELLATFVEVGCTASGSKMVLATPILRIVGYLCSINGYSLNHGTASKILNWPVPKNTKQLRGFLGTAGIARPWIKDFAAIAKPMTVLLQKNKQEEPFEWSEKAQEAMNKIKQAASAMPALQVMDVNLAKNIERYDPKTKQPYSIGQVILAVDTSSMAVGYILKQVLKPKTVNILKYGSITFNERETRYQLSQSKLELFGVFRAISEVQMHVYALNLIIEVDALYLKDMIKKPSLPNAAMNRWLDHIKSFHPIWVWKTHAQHAAPDGLSRRPPAPEDTEVTNDELEPDEGGHYIKGPRPSDMIDLPLLLDKIDSRKVLLNKLEWTTEEPTDIHNIIDPPYRNQNPHNLQRWVSGKEHDQPVAKLYSALVTNISTSPDSNNDSPEPIEPEDEEEDNLIPSASSREIWPSIIKYLKKGILPESVTNIRGFRNKIRNFILEKDQLWRIGKNAPQKVITDVQKRPQLIRQAHDDSGHRGRDPTYAKLCDSFWWPQMYKEVTEFCKTCTPCQMRSTYIPKVEIRPTSVKTILRRFSIDVVHMKTVSNGYAYIVDARDNLTGWLEACRLKTITASNIADFLYEHIICRFGCILELTCDNGSEFKGIFEQVAKNHHIHLVRTSPYNPQGNGQIEEGHHAWIPAIWKSCGKKASHWSKWFLPSLWADRVSTRRTTGFSPYHLLYGTPHIFPFDITESTWYTIPWEEVNSRIDLLTVRMEQIAQLRLDRTQAAKKTIQARMQSALDYAKRNQHRLSNRKFRKGEMVIVSKKRFPTKEGSRKKSDESWAGPYRIHSITLSGSYKIMELDGVKLHGSIPARHLKFFRIRKEEITEQELKNRKDQSSSEDDGDRQLGDSDYHEGSIGDSENSYPSK